MLKLFPAEQLPPAVVKAWRAVLPWDVPVGGVAPETMAAFVVGWGEPVVEGRAL